METHYQRTKETAVTYILEKSKLLQQCQELINEGAYLPHLIRGRNSAELRGALSLDIPTTTEALMETIEGMEVYQPASLAFYSVRTKYRNRSPMDIRLAPLKGNTLRLGGRISLREVTI